MTIIYPGIFPMLKWTLVATSLLAIMSCKKEKDLEPSYKDENYFVVKDNPDDPVDHAIYNFFVETGIACFYNDTIARRKVSRDGVTPEQYQYITLSLHYHPAGNNVYEVFKLKNKAILPPVLELIKTKVLTRMKQPRQIPNILFIDSFSYFYKFTDIRLQDGMSSVTGYNTLAVRAMDMEKLGEEEKDLYACSILAGFIFDRVNKEEYSYLLDKFYSITRSFKIPAMPFDNYLGVEAFLLYGLPVPVPESIGLTHFPKAALFAGTTSLPIEETDLRAFIMNTLRFTADEIAVKYAGYDAVIRKDRIVRELVERYGFTIAK